MEEVIEMIETLIDDIERDSHLTREETLEALREIKNKVEDFQLNLDY